MLLGQEIGEEGHVGRGRGDVYHTLEADICLQSYISQLVMNCDDSA